jgi:hypothetical protein
MRIVLYATLPLALAVLSTLRSRAVASTHNSRYPCLRRKFFSASRKPYDVTHVEVRERLCSCCLRFPYPRDRRLTPPHHVTVPDGSCVLKWRHQYLNPLLRPH